MQTLRPIGSPAISSRTLALDLGMAALLCLCLSLAAAGLGTWSTDYYLVVLLFWSLFCGAVLAAWTSEPGSKPFGLANRVTLLRGLLVGLPAGTLAIPDLPLNVEWIIAGLAATAALLDALDGWLARHLDECSQFGERFDLEVDAVLVLILSALAWQLDKAGAWVLLSGLLRYLLLIAGALAPWLQAALPSSRRRQIVCALQTTALVIVVMPATPAWLAGPLALFGLLALTGSFAKDILWLRSKSNLGGYRQ